MTSRSEAPERRIRYRPPIMIFKSSHMQPIGGGAPLLAASPDQLNSLARQVARFHSTWPEIKGPQLMLIDLRHHQACQHLARLRPPAQGDLNGGGAQLSSVIPALRPYSRQPPVLVLVRFRPVRFQGRSGKKVREMRTPTRIINRAARPSSPTCLRPAGGSVESSQPG